jgi:recombinational DNA repair protein (RecF pathway)
MADRCAMIIGFLVPHRCEEGAIAACARCARRYCQEHVALSAAGLLCSACAAGRAQPVVLAAAAGAALGAVDLAAFSDAEASGLDDEREAFSDLS